MTEIPGNPQHSSDLPATVTHKAMPDRPLESRHEPQRGGSIKPNQLKAIYGLARRKRLDPQKLVHERFDRYVPEDLTLLEASELLDELKQEHGVTRHST